MNIIVAITTAPRKDCTLLECVNHVRATGWEPIIFAEPESTSTDCQTFQNDKVKGVWHNWLNASRWCVENSNADAVLTLQDDTFIHPDSKDFCNKCLWPSPDTGFVSLYTPKHYSFGAKNKRREPGINRVRTKGLWGACALIFPREVLRRVINSKIASQWLGNPPKSGGGKVYERRIQDPSLIMNSDTAIGKIINHMNRSMWFVEPSAAYHAAYYSACGHGDNTGRRNCVRKADFLKSLTDQIPTIKKVDIEL